MRAAYLYMLTGFLKLVVNDSCSDHLPLGQVCAGSSLFLRARFGNGYYLTLVRDDGITKIIDDADQDQQQQLQLLDENQRIEEISLEEVKIIFVRNSTS